MQKNGFIILLWMGCALHPLLSQGISPESDVRDALVEREDIRFEIFNGKKARMTVEASIRVFTEEGKAAGMVRLEEDRFKKVKKLEGRVFDNAGKEFWKSGKNDIRKAEISPGFVVYSDNKYKWLEMSAAQYPYRLSYTYSIEYNTLFYWPNWHPQGNYPVLLATYTLVLPDSSFPFQHHGIGMEMSPEASYRAGRYELKWTAGPLPRRRREDFMPPENHRQKAILFSPQHFTVDKYSGHLLDWSGLANFYRSLARKRYALPPAARALVNDLIMSAGDDREKVNRIYDYLQNDTRYVAIHLGIGGWQPHSAASVFENKYGDCKDLSTYMIAMLDAAGIKAYPALTPTRDLGMLIGDFPSNQFNHCITMVPLAEDTVWLECTADYIPAGELPPAVEGVDVLVVTEDGGEIVRTPLSAPDANRWESRISGSLTATGHLTMKGYFRTSGNQSHDARNMLMDEEPRKRIVRRLGANVSRVDLAGYSASDYQENGHQPIQVAFDGTMGNIARVSPRRLFLNPNILHRHARSYYPEESPEDRQFPVYFPYPYFDSDTVKIELPPNFTELEGGPPTHNIELPFASYRTGYMLNERLFTYWRTLSIRQRLIERSAYADYRDFMTTVARNDNASFVFKKGTL